MASLVWHIDGVQVPGSYARISDLAVGESRDLTITTYDADGVAATQSAATVHVYDPAIATKGDVTSGSTTTIVTADLSEADDYWNGMPLTVTHADGTQEHTVITDWVQSTTTLTFNAIRTAAASGATFEVGAIPVLVEAAISPSVNSGVVTVNATDALSRSGYRLLVYSATVASRVYKLFVQWKVKQAP